MSKSLGSHHDWCLENLPVSNPEQAIQNAVDMLQPKAEQRTQAKIAICEVLQTVDGFRRMHGNKRTAYESMTDLAEACNGFHRKLKRLEAESSTLVILATADQVMQHEGTRDASKPNIATMLPMLISDVDYLKQLCESESARLEPAVAPSHRPSSSGNWKYFLVLHCHQLVEQYSPYKPVTTLNSRFHAFVESMHGALTDDYISPVSDQIRCIVRQEKRRKKSTPKL